MQVDFFETQNFFEIVSGSFTHNFFHSQFSKLHWFFYTEGKKYRHDADLFFRLVLAAFEHFRLT